MVREQHERFGLQCKGRLQACHVHGRFYGHTLWDLRNGLPGCEAVNIWTETHPHEWEDICREVIGNEVYDALRRQAMDPAPLEHDDWVHHLGLGEGPGPVPVSLLAPRP